jgi:hypothetical protein
MKTTHTRFSFRFLVVLTMGLLLLTHIVQARQGLLPGGSGESFEAHHICESESVLPVQHSPRRGVAPSIIESPLLIPALTGILTSVDHTPASAIVGLALASGLVQMIVQREICSGEQLAIRFIPPLPFSSVLRL